MDFYDEIVDVYDLIYPNWEESIRKQADALDQIIGTKFLSITRIHDVSCGIGTQVIGLLQNGYTVSASDLSPKSIERANQELKRHDLSASLSVCDMREVDQVIENPVDLILSCDNSLPHWLDPRELVHCE